MCIFYWPMAFVDKCHVINDKICAFGCSVSSNAVSRTCYGPLYDDKLQCTVCKASYNTPILHVCTNQRINTLNDIICSSCCVIGIQTTDEQGQTFSIQNNRTPTISAMIAILVLDEIRRYITMDKHDLFDKKNKIGWRWVMNSEENVSILGSSTFIDVTIEIYYEDIQIFQIISTFYFLSVFLKNSQIMGPYWLVLNVTNTNIYVFGS